MFPTSNAIIFWIRSNNLTPAPAEERRKGMKIDERPLMTSNIPKEKCPKCGATETDTMTPRTTYECGSSDYDQRPGTFIQSEKCKQNETMQTEPIS